MLSLVLVPVLVWFYPRARLLPIAAALPVLEFWLLYGLGSTDRDGFENWGLLVLPVVCLLSFAAATSVLLVRRDHVRRRRDRPDRR